jgi:hypothetical protein
MTRAERAKCRHCDEQVIDTGNGRAAHNTKRHRCPACGGYFGGHTKECER